MLTWDAIANTGWTKVLLQAARDLIFAATPDGAKVRLFQNNYTPSIASVLADFTQATFTGYAQAELLDTMAGLPRIDTDGNVYIVCNSVLSFTQTADTTPNTVYGYYVVSDVGSHIIAAKRFDTPIEFNAAGIALDLELAFRLIATGFQGGDDPTVSAGGDSD